MILLWITILHIQRVNDLSFGFDFILKKLLNIKKYNNL